MSIHSEAENDYVSGIHVTIGRTAWIGYNDLGGREGGFLWTDGSPISGYSNFFQGKFRTVMFSFNTRGKLP